MSQRTASEIIADPQAAGEEIYLLATTDPVAALSHANCPLYLWLSLAENRPLVAIDSPAFALIMLEDPRPWTEMETRCAEIWSENALGRLRFREQELFLADCAEHVLHIYEEKFPGDSRVRDAIAARRQWATGVISLEAWGHAWRAAMQAAREALKSEGNSLAAEAGYSAAEEGRNVMREGWRAVGDSRRRQESVWQWRRLLDYLRGKA